MNYVVDPDTGCWLWQRATQPNGYGRIGDLYAHRVFYERHVGPIPDGLTLDHLCRVRRCVNPAHLEPVTTAENLRRGNGWSGINARKTHCPSGHAYDVENTYIYRGMRMCRECRRTQKRAAYRRRTAAT